jgi:SAM-dependent methyltransferase
MMATNIDKQKAQVRDFWEEAACGETLFLSDADMEGFEREARIRYEIEPYIPSFADFPSARGRDVLEIGVGLGADHVEFARNGARLTGIDLTERAIALTRQRMAVLGLSSDLRVGDAENLPFADNSFDWVYSWGVIHHSPDTPKAAREILRVLRPGGRFAVMIYQRKSIIGYMLWLRYALLRGRPLTSLDTLYAKYLESPGTKTYSLAEAAALFPGARDVRTSSVLTHGDLLETDVGQRHRGALLKIARTIWPRWFIRRVLPGHGLFLLVAGYKA